MFWPKLMALYDREVPDQPDTNSLFGSELWRPSEQRVKESNIYGFAASANERPDYDSLLAWSLEQPGEFWSSVWDYCGVVGQKGSVAFQKGDHMRADRFFLEARLNLASNFLRKSGPTAAIVAYEESGQRRVVSWDELRSQVGAFGAALSAEGVGLGDRVVAFLPHGIEAIVAMIATVSLGATFSTASPDFGTAGVLDRFSQIDPKVLVGCVGYSYAGKWFDTTDRLREISNALPTLKRTVVVSSEVRTQDAGWVGYDDFIGAHAGAEVCDDLYPYDNPWYVLYSSGTTGKPKCFVHRSGGVLLTHMKEHRLQSNLNDGDVVMYFTTTGWMMWNWLVSALTSGCTIVCVDGSPFHPSPSMLFDLVDREGVNLLGVGAKFIDSLRKEGLRPVDTHDLASLATVCSTGSPLAAEGFAYVYDAIKADVHLASISGGTDLCGCFVAGDPTSPVFAGENQKPGLGMAADVWGAEGMSLRSQPNARGELVCTQSFPSMPIGFWGDELGAKYQVAYFDRFPGRDVWAHGDFAAWTAHGGFVIHGRSDSTLNPGGVRIGTAEIYRQVEQLPQIVESLVFGQDFDGDSRIVLLVRLAAGVVLDDGLRAEIRRGIRANCSPRHVPAVIAAVNDLPRTRSGKLTELAVADIVNGREVRNTEAMANPEALWNIAQLPELKV